MRHVAFYECRLLLASWKLIPYIRNWTNVEFQHSVYDKWTSEMQQQYKKLWTQQIILILTTSSSGSGSGSISGCGSVSGTVSTVDSMHGIHVQGTLEPAPFGRSTTGHHDEWTRAICGCGGGGGGADCGVSDNSHTCCCSNWCCRCVWGWWQYNCWGTGCLQKTPSCWSASQIRVCGWDQSVSIPPCTASGTGNIYWN